MATRRCWARPPPTARSIGPRPWATTCSRTCPPQPPTLRDMASRRSNICSPNPARPNLPAPLSVPLAPAGCAGRRAYSRGRCTATGLSSRGTLKRRHTLSGTASRHDSYTATAPPAAPSIATSTSRPGNPAHLNQPASTPAAPQSASRATGRTQRLHHMFLVIRRVMRRGTPRQCRHSTQFGQPGIFNAPSTLTPDKVRRRTRDLLRRAQHGAPEPRQAPRWLRPVPRRFPAE